MGVLGVWGVWASSVGTRASRPLGRTVSDAAGSSERVEPARLVPRFLEIPVDFGPADFGRRGLAIRISTMQPDLRERWDREGWLHLHGIVPREAVERVNATVDEIWRSKPRNVTIDDLDEGVRTRMDRAHDSQRAHRIKLNDLYLESAAVRAVFLDPAILGVITELLGDGPVLCNTLNLERSSAQEYHADSLYMTPLSEGGLVAAWVALGDVREGSGPLRLYPGSHRFPSFSFSDGSRHAIPVELPAWAKHMQAEIDRRSLEPAVVIASAGDVVLWHADLLHGAEPIRNSELRRESMVGHYFGRRDCHALGYRLARSEGGLWIRRSPQPVDFPSRARAALERRWNGMRASLRRWRDRRTVEW